MGVTLYGVGSYPTWNLLAHPSTVLAAEVAAASSTHPLSFLADGNQAKPFRFATDAADVRIKANMGSAKTARLLSLHGHNLVGVTFIELWTHTADVFGSATLAAKIVPLYKRASMYIYVPAGVSRQYWWVVFKGTNGSPIWIGDMTLSNPLVVSAKVLHPMVTEYREAHVRHVTPAGRREVFERTAWGSRYVLARFKGTLGARDQVVDSVFRASRADLNPMLFIPRAPETLTTGGSGEQVFALTEQIAILGHLEPPELVVDDFAPALARWTVGVQEDSFTEPLA